MDIKGEIICGHIVFELIDLILSMNDKIIAASNFRGESFTV